MTLDVPGIPTSFVYVDGDPRRIRIFLRGCVPDVVETVGELVVRTVDRRDRLSPAQIVLDVFVPTGPEGARLTRLRYRLWPEMIDRIEYDVQRVEEPELSRRGRLRRLLG